MSSGDIEDVLSQVRRLVSHDLRPETGRDGPARAAVQEPGSEKLILTQALRVVPNATERVAQRLGRAGADDDTSDDGPEILSLQTAFDAALRAEAARRAQHAPPPFATPRSAAANEALPLRAKMGPSPLAERTLAPTLVAKSTSHPSEAAMRTDAAFEADDPPAPFAQVPPSTDEADRSAAHFDSIHSATTKALVQDAEPADQSASAAGDDAEVRSAGPAPGDDIVGAFASVRARHGAAWADCAAAEAAAQIARDEPGLQVFDPDQEMNFDEEVLRDLVRDILREQLQGALGERITRNVRKLVRAELNRALLGRDTH